MLIRLVGGLGNQMFIYAFAKAMSLKGYPILLDAIHFKDIFKKKDSVKITNTNTGGGGARPTTFLVNVI